MKTFKRLDKNMERCGSLKKLINTRENNLLLVKDQLQRNRKHCEFEEGKSCVLPKVYAQILQCRRDRRRDLRKAVIF